MKAFILLFLSVTFYNVAISQEIEALKLGEKIPEVQLGRFLNNPLKQENISELKGKLIIFDFWNIHCASCIASMPRMDSLQKEFNENIQVIFVTKNSAEEVNHLFSRTNIQKPDVPFIINDTILNELFPHYGDPLHVWINQEGYVQAITFDYNTTPETIQKFLNGIDPQLSRRNDFGLNLKYPLLSEQNSSILDKAESYSILIKGLNEYTTAGNTLFIQKDSCTGLISRIRTINASKLMLYNIAFDKEIFDTDINIFNLPKNNRIILETKDSTDFYIPKKESKIADWVMKNSYSYEIKLSNKNESQAYKFMQQDLNKYLPFKASIEKRKIKCLILRNISNENMVKTKHAEGPSFVHYNEDQTVSMQNMPIASLILQLIYWNTNIKSPIVDGTTISDNVDIAIHSRFNDIKSLNKELQHYGLTLSEEEKEIKMLVITDKILNSNSRFETSGYFSIQLKTQF